MKLVKFTDGTYGVRVKFSIFGFKWNFLDLKNIRFCWDRDDNFFEHCKGTREKAEYAMRNYSDKHTVVKD